MRNNVHDQTEEKSASSNNAYRQYKTSWVMCIQPLDASQDLTVMFSTAQITKTKNMKQIIFELLLKK